MRYNALGFCIFPVGGDAQRLSSALRGEAMKRRVVFAACLLSTVMALLPISLAFFDGASEGYTAGPISPNGVGADCTACHFYNDGGGQVELLGAPERYRAGVVYDMTVRVADPEQIGAGFEISAENLSGHGGMFIADTQPPIRTQLASSNPNYLTHTFFSYADSLNQWGSNGGAYSFPIQWQAPVTDVGRLTFFTAGNAVFHTQINPPATNPDIADDRYYAARKTIGFAEPGDADGDADLDLADFASFQRCYNDDMPSTDPGCEYLYLDSDDSVSLDDAEIFIGALDGPIALDPGSYVMADEMKGGLLYDKWWREAGLAAPTTDHPLWASRPDLVSNTRSGSTTWRCKECHGWDYKGVDGAYATGSHRTGFPGILGTTLQPSQMFELLKNPPSVELTNGHDYASVGLSDAAIWDVVKMALVSTTDVAGVIGACSTSATSCTIDNECPMGETCNAKGFVGNALFGQIDYVNLCSSCHDPASGLGGLGTGINFGSDLSPVYVGTVAAGNPWEFIHKVRFGHPASPMPAMDLLGFTLQDAADLGAYSATLPIN